MYKSEVSFFLFLNFFGSVYIHYITCDVFLLFKSSSIYLPIAKHERAKFHHSLLSAEIVVGANAIVAAHLLNI